MKIVATVQLLDTDGGSREIRSAQPAERRARSWIAHQRASHGEYPDGKMTAATIDALLKQGREVLAAELLYNWSAFERGEP